MASTILLRNIASADDKRIVFSNSQAARLFSIGTNWTKLRVGLRLSIQDSGANLTGTPRFAVGVCSGTTNIYGDSTATHFVGIRTSQATWNRIVGPPMRYDSISLETLKRVGSTDTIGGGTTSSMRIWDATTANRSVFFLDITKGSPNFTFALFCRTTVDAGDVLSTTFLQEVESSSPAIAEHANLVITPSTLAVDEGVDGNLNAVNIHWNNSAAPIEISDVAIVRLI